MDAGESAPKTFHCRAPWTSLFVDTSGQARFCCYSKPLGNLNDQSLAHVLGSEKLRKVRTDMLEKGSSDACLNCMIHEKETGSSLRALYGTDLTSFQPDSSELDHIDVRWNNTCQLKCVYCNGDDSSSHAAREGKPRISGSWETQILEFLSESKGRPYRSVHLGGGEPLLLKQNLKLLDLLHPDQRIVILTNLALRDFESLPVAQELFKRRVTWCVSMEAIGNKFEYIRRNAKWEQVRRNYVTLKSLLNPRSLISVNMTYCVLSAFSLCETFNWLSLQGACTHNLHLLHYPRHFAVSSFSRRIKRMAIREIDLTLKWHKTYLTPPPTRFLENTRQFLETCPDEQDPENLRAFQNFVATNDREVAPVSFASEWPEVADAVSLSLS